MCEKWIRWTEKESENRREQERRLFQCKPINNNEWKKKKFFYSKKIFLFVAKEERKKRNTKSKHDDVAIQLCESW